MSKRFIFVSSIILVSSTILIAVSILALSAFTTIASAKQVEIPPSPAVPGDLIIEYQISGSALNIVSAAPNDIWFTMPTANKIGHIVVDSAGAATVTEYSVPTANSEPYDLVFDSINNAIWFTEKSASQLGRLDIATQVITEIGTIPTANSMPTGITIAPDDSIWFAESGANKLGQYVPSTNTFSESPAYTPTTAGVTNAEFHDIAIADSGAKVWVTSPADHQVLQYLTQTNGFSSLALSGPFDPIAGSSRQPYNITYAGGDIVWLTDIANNQIGQLSQGTLANVAWYTLPTSASNPTGITFGTTGGPGTIFFTGNTTDLAGSLSNSGDGSRAPSEYNLSSGSQPAGITMDSSGNVWIALGGSNKIALWQAPYYELIFLPIISRS